MMRLTLALSCAAIVGLSTSCASKLERDLTHKAPVGSGLVEALPMNDVKFTDFASGRTLSLAEYMDEAGRDHLLLVFGSKGCAACNSKATHLRDDAIGQHPLYLTDAGRRFEIIGINTDPDTKERLSGLLQQFPFIQWSDPRGNVMMNFFMPPGVPISVPLTVMINRQGIKWRVLPNEPRSVEWIMNEVTKTLGLGGASDGDPTDDGGDGGEGDGGDGGGEAGGEGDGGGGDGIAGIDLAAEGKGRFKLVEMQGCNAAAVNLHDALDGADVKFVQVVRGACGADCEANLAQLASLESGCKVNGAAKTCASATLAADALGALCAGAHKSRVYRGGDEFFQVFGTHFDWNYQVTEGPPPDYALTIPEVAGPLVLGFNADGRLVFSHEGKLAGGQVAAAMAKPGFGTSTPGGPDFKLYSKADGEFRFGSYRQQARYTVVMAWGAYPVPCTSCIAELKHWSAPGQLVDYCTARPTQCQVVGLETHLPDNPEDPAAMAAFYEGIINGDGQGFEGIGPMGIRVPLVLDPLPINGPNGNEYLRRVFDGYMLASVPEWGFDYRTFVYDREGKVIARFKAEEPGAEDPVLKLMKRLIDQN
jgi:hypothetical protein